MDEEKEEATIKLAKEWNSLNPLLSVCVCFSALANPHPQSQLH
jgi:hypothetical protein